MIRTNATIPQVTVSRANARYAKATGTLFADATKLGLDGWPLILDVRSERTGNVRRFIRGKMQMEGPFDDQMLLGVQYADRQNGMILWVGNDNPNQ